METKVITILGGTGALGQSLTRAFLEQGCTVVVSWYDPAEWSACCQLFQGNPNYTGIETDVTDEASVQRFFQTVTETYHRVDAMIYLAGIFSVGPRLWECDIRKLQNMLVVNSLGALTACKYALPPMLRQNSGNIILMPAKSVLVGTPHFGAYAMSKGPLLPLMETLTAELKETDISVNCVMPDAMITPITLNSPHAQPDKWVTTEDVAEIIVSVCCSKGNIVRGAVLKCFGK